MHLSLPFTLVFFFFYVCLRRFHRFLCRQGLFCCPLYSRHFRSAWNLGYFSCNLVFVAIMVVGFRHDRTEVFRPIRSWKRWFFLDLGKWLLFLDLVKRWFEFFCRVVQEFKFCFRLLNHSLNLFMVLS